MASDHRAAHIGLIAFLAKRNQDRNPLGTKEIQLAKIEDEAATFGNGAPSVIGYAVDVRRIDLAGSRDDRRRALGVRWRQVGVRRGEAARIVCSGCLAW